MCLSVSQISLIKFIQSRLDGSLAGDCAENDFPRRQAALIWRVSYRATRAIHTILFLPAADVIVCFINRRRAQKGRLEHVRGYEDNKSTSAGRARSNEKQESGFVRMRLTLKRTIKFPVKGLFFEFP